jgi:hypothetical protein
MFKLMVFRREHDQSSERSFHPDSRLCGILIHHTDLRQQNNHTFSSGTDHKAISFSSIGAVAGQVRHEKPFNWTVSEPSIRKYEAHLGPVESMARPPRMGSHSSDTVGDPCDRIAQKSDH